MSIVQNVQSILAGLVTLKGMASTTEQVDTDNWLAFAKTLSNEPQWNSANVDKLNELRAAAQSESALLDHIMGYYSLVFTWALNEDAREANGMSHVPFPPPTQDVAAFASQNSVSLEYVPVGPPPPVIHAQWVFMVSGGFLAVISPTTGKDSRTGKDVYDALRGDTVPDGQLVTTPDGIELQRHFVELPFGPEHWYTAV